MKIYMVSLLHRATINKVHFNVSVTSRDLQTSRLGLVSKFKRLVSAGEANVSVSSQSREANLSVSAIDVSCPSLGSSICSSSGGGNGGDGGQGGGVRRRVSVFSWRRNDCNARTPRNRNVTSRIV